MLVSIGGCFNGRLLLIYAVAVLDLVATAPALYVGHHDSLEASRGSSVEEVLDALSWEVYVAESRGANQSKLVTAGNYNQSDIFEGHEVARIQRFLAAVKRAASLNVDGGHGKHFHFREGEHGSGYCCHHLAPNDPYWQQTEDYSRTHPGYIKCQYSNDCQAPVTNANRVNSIRRALHGSKALFLSLGISNLLYGGSALGQYRCGDVIPWDVDCDFLVDEKGLEKIHMQVFGVSLNNSQFQQGETSSDLARFGAPGIVLVKKFPHHPFEIVDTKTGFFCDVFASKWQGDSMYTPWWAGPTACQGMFPHSQGHQQCYRFPEGTVYPPQPCYMASEQQPCPPDMPRFLEITYGSGFRHPDRPGVR